MFNMFFFREIAFKHGDVLRIHRQLDSNWLEGERNGQIGVFPITYVQVLLKYLMLLTL